MIEAILYFALGLLTAGLLSLAVAPAIWRRAERLARRQIEANLPLSLNEVRAEKDQLRAGFAMSARRLEIKSEELKAASNEQSLEIARGRTEIARLEADRSAKAEVIESLEARILERESELAAAGDRIDALTVDIAAREVALEAGKQEIKSLEAGLAAAQLLSEEQKVELVARDTTIGNLDDTIETVKASETEAVQANDRLAAELAEERSSHAAARRLADDLAARITAFEAERADRQATLQRRAGEIKALTAELAAESVRREQLTEELDRLRRGDGADSEALPSSTHNIGAAPPSEAYEAEIAALKSELAALEREAGALRAEVASLREEAAREPDTVPLPKGDRNDDEEIRGRLQDVATAVIEMVRANEPTTPQGGNGQAEPADRDASDAPETVPEKAATSEPARPTTGQSLAQRIRALQRADAG